MQPPFGAIEATLTEANRRVTIALADITSWSEGAGIVNIWVIGKGEPWVVKEDYDEIGRRIAAAVQIALGVVRN